jgi:hypothetical protein
LSRGLILFSYFAFPQGWLNDILLLRDLNPTAQIRGAMEDCISYFRTFGVNVRNCMGDPDSEEHSARHWSLGLPHWRHKLTLNKQMHNNSDGDIRIWFQNYMNPV